MEKKPRKHGPTKHGTKWRIRPIDEHGKRVSMVFDDYKTAQHERRKLQAHVGEVKRGLRRATPVDKTLNDLCDLWLEKRTPQKRSQKDDKSIIRKHLRPAFGSVKVRDIGVEDWDDYVNEHDHLAEKTVDNHRSVLRAMLNYVAQLKVPWLLTVPKFRAAQIVVGSSDYQWLRSDDEIARFLAAARREGEQVFVLYATAVYTGLRVGELAGQKRCTIDFDRRLIAVTCSYDGPTKTNRVRYVPILDPLLPILRAWCETMSTEYVFTNRDGRMLQPSSRIFQEVLHRVLDDAGFPKRMVRGKERPYIRFHDLRHTFASHWVLCGGDIYRLQRLLGHTSVKLTERYAHLSPSAFASDWSLMGCALPAVRSSDISPSM